MTKPTAASRAREMLSGSGDLGGYRPEVPARVPILSASAARRIALAAQGFAEPRPAGRVGRRELRRLVDRIGLIQIDSVSTLVRAHELPAFARLGPYPRTLIKDSTERHRDLFEYWGHAACLMPIRTQPLWRWRMHAMRDRERRWVDRIQRERPGYVDAVLAEVRERGPITAGELSDGGAATGPWWGWADGKVAIEHLFSIGELSVASRRNTFERAYDVTERVIPGAVLAAATPSLEDAHRELVRIVSRALGIATRKDIATYFYLAAARVSRSIAELVELGELEPVMVDGWSDRAYLAAGAARVASTPGRSWPRSTRSSSTVPASNGSSGCATESRSTHRRRSASTATTSCHSCSARRWSGGSTSRRTGRGRAWSCRLPTARSASIERPSRRRWPTSCDS